MIAATTARALDGRPTIEVTVMQLHDESVSLEGTASVYEGNVTIVTITDGVRLRAYHAQANAGGPGRGEWHASIPVHGGITHIEVGEEEMEEGAATAHTRRVEIRLRSH